MLCNSCGKALQDKSMYCKECAEKLGYAPRADREQHSESTKTGSSNSSSTEPSTSESPLTTNQEDSSSNLEAGFRFHRFVAAAIDKAFLGIGLSLIGGILAHLITAPLTKFLESLSNGTGTHGGMLLSIIVWAIPFITLMVIGTVSLQAAYFVLFETSKLRATPGKFLVGLQVVSTAGNTLTMVEAIVRVVAKSAMWLASFPFAALMVIVLFASGSAGSSDMSPAVFTVLIVLALAAVVAVLAAFWCGFVWILYKPDRRALHDKLSGSFVVNHDPKSTPLVAVMLLVALTVSSFVDQNPGNSTSINLDDRDRKWDMQEQGHPVESHRDTVHDQAQSQPGIPVPVQDASPDVPASAPGTDLTPGATGALSSAELSATFPQLIDRNLKSDEATGLSTTANQLSDTSSSAERPVGEDTTSHVKAIEPPTAENAIRFLNARREFVDSRGFISPDRKWLRIYLSQGGYTSFHEAALSRHELNGLKDPPATDVVIVARFDTPIEDDCSLSSASRVSVYLYRTGIAGFPLPGRKSPIVLETNELPASLNKIRCGAPSTSGLSSLTGRTKGSGSYRQGAAEYPLSWDLELRN